MIFWDIKAQTHAFVAVRVMTPLNRVISTLTETKQPDGIVSPSFEVCYYFASLGIWTSGLKLKWVIQIPNPSQF